jgi:3-isopropylmalate/(R)-2-methylmalate dehydratase small subunit
MIIKIKDFKGKGIAVRGNEIDTDRIIPARFMKCITFDGLGAYAFNDERVDGNGKSKGHPFDDKRWSGHPVLVGNANFGCGSSREHAPQALKDYGVMVVIAESFAEIFAGNCSSLGMPALTLTNADIASLQDLIEKHPDTEISIDLVKMKVTAGKNEWTAKMPESYRNALLDGSWDSTAVLAEGGKEIDGIAARLPYV